MNDKKFAAVVVIAALVAVAIGLKIHGVHS
jgi:hypothetical protein